MTAILEELPEAVVEKARQFINLQQGKNATKGWATRALLTWIADADIEEPETTLSRITSAPFTQPNQKQDVDDFSETNWVLVLREMESRGLGKLVLGRHKWPTRFSWRNRSALRTACAVLERPFRTKVRRQSPNDPPQSRTGPTPSTLLMIGRIEVKLPLGGASEEEWAELSRWISRRGG